MKLLIIDTDISPDKYTRRQNTVYVFIFFLSAYWLLNNGFDTSEACYHYAIAEQIVNHGTLGIDEPREGIFTIGPDGRTYASHEFGNTLALIPTAFINFGIERLLSRAQVPHERIEQLKQFIMSFQAGVYAALTLSVLFRILLQYRMPTQHAFLGCCAVGFGTFFASYGRNLFDGLLCALLLTSAIFALMRYRETNAMSLVVIAFALLGYSVTTRLSMVIPTAIALAFVCLASNRRLSPVALAILTLVPFAMWQLWYNQLRTGNYLISPVQTAQYADNNAFDGDLRIGLLGLLISPGKSLFVYAPILLLSIAAMPKFWRRDKLMAVLVGATFVLWLLLHGKLRSWYGAWGWGPRHFVTIVPLLALPGLVSFGIHPARRWQRLIFSFLVASGLTLSLAATIGNWHYRMVLATQEMRLDDRNFIWGWRSQAADMVTGAVHNIGVLFGIAEPEFVPTISSLNNTASNGLNLWWYTLPHAGAPWWLVLIGVVILLITLIWSASRIMAGVPCR
ncbi:MAG: hypothetical protein C0483_17545 [Pirellula sp.]|nr:hypothetical protein [Pirellula sp.]